MLFRVQEAINKQASSNYPDWMNINSGKEPLHDMLIHYIQIWKIKTQLPTSWYPLSSSMLKNKQWRWKWYILVKEWSYGDFGVKNDKTSFFFLRHVAVVDQRNSQGVFQGSVLSQRWFLGGQYCMGGANQCAVCTSWPRDTCVGWAWVACHPSRARCSIGCVPPDPRGTGGRVGPGLLEGPGAASCWLPCGRDHLYHS